MAGPHDPGAEDVFNSPAINADEGRPQEDDGEDGEVAALSNSIGDTVPTLIFQAGKRPVLRFRGAPGGDGLVDDVNEGFFK